MPYTQLPTGAGSRSSTAVPFWESPPLTFAVAVAPSSSLVSVGESVFWDVWFPVPTNCRREANRSASTTASEKDESEEKLAAPPSDSDRRIANLVPDMRSVLKGLRVQNEHPSSSWSPKGVERGAEMCRWFGEGSFEGPLGACQCSTFEAE